MQEFLRLILLFSSFLSFFNVVGWVCMDGCAYKYEVYLLYYQVKYRINKKNLVKSHIFCLIFYQIYLFFFIFLRWYKKYLFQYCTIVLFFNIAQQNIFI